MNTSGRCGYNGYRHQTDEEREQEELDRIYNDNLDTPHLMQGALNDWRREKEEREENSGGFFSWLFGG